MPSDLPVYIGSDAIGHLIQFSHERGLDRFTLVADDNTYQALGQRLEGVLREAGYDLKTIVLAGPEVIPDEHSVVQVLLQAPTDGRPYLAVGSGTLTDITRFVSHRTRTDFISIPTAPSVDGFTSVGAPMVIGRWKQTVPTQPPIGVFADEGTLQAAPRPMIASGFGDMMGKYTALADWELGALLWDEPFDAVIAQRARRALESCMAAATQIRRGEAGGICAQMEGLIETGLCMVAVGSSRPAGGSEHHLSHYWEMKLLLEGRKPILHGMKVGVATTLVARRYAALRAMSQADAAARLAESPYPDRQREVTEMRSVLGPLAEAAVIEQEPFLALAPDDVSRLKQRIVEHWSMVQAIAAKVPSPEQLVELLDEVGAPTNTQALGLHDDEVRVAYEYAHYLRDRLTVNKFAHLLNL